MTSIPPDGRRSIVVLLGVTQHDSPFVQALHEHATVGIADERRAVELHTTFVADPVDHDHERPVRDAVGRDHLLPQWLGVEVGMVDEVGPDSPLGVCER